MVTPYLTAKETVWINGKASSLGIPDPLTPMRSDCRVSVA